MANYTSILLCGVTLMAAYLILHREHRMLAGIVYMAIGGATYLFQAANNPYGVIIIAIGGIVTVTAPFTKRRIE